MTFATLLAAAALLPGFAPAGTSPGGGELLRGFFPDVLAPQPLSPGYVYLPPNFTASKRYPVTYLLHGMAPPRESTATFRRFPARKGHWLDEVRAGLSWAFGV